MSHFTKLDKAQVRDKKAFIKAAQELGFEGKVTENAEIKDFYGKRETVDVAIKVGSADLGLKKDVKTGRFDMVADFWGIRRNLSSEQREKFGGSESDIQDALLRKTAKHDIISNYRRQGFTARVKENADNSINITLTRGG